MSAKHREASEDKVRQILAGLSLGSVEGVALRYYMELLREPSSLLDLRDFLDVNLPSTFGIIQSIPSEDAPCEPSDTFFVAERSPDERAPLSAQDHLQTLREQIDDLRIRNERQRSIIAQERRLAAREAQRNSQLLAQLDKQRATCDKMVGTLSDMAKANRTLQEALTREKEGRLRMFESYEGVVMHVDDDSVVVTYSINGDYVDQTYNKDQFIGGRLPRKGDRLAVYVHVAELPKERPEEETSPRSPDEQREYRKHAIRPPREF